MAVGHPPTTANACLIHACLANQDWLQRRDGSKFQHTCAISDVVNPWRSSGVRPRSFFSGFLLWYPAHNLSARSGRPYFFWHNDGHIDLRLSGWIISLVGVEVSKTGVKTVQDRGERIWLVHVIDDVGLKLMDKLFLEMNCYVWTPSSDF